MKILRNLSLGVLVVLVLAMTTSQACAYQASINVPNGTGAAVRSNLNNALQAITTQQSGAAAPSVTYPYQVWADLSTTPITLRIRNGANTAWVVIGTLNNSANTFLAVNADQLDGSHASAFATAAQGAKADAALPSASYTASDVLTKIKTVDGTGSGLDADTVRGVNPVTIAAPPGSVMMFAGNVVPTGWLECNGAQVSRTTYADLFAALVTNAGFTSQSFTVTIANPAVFTKAAHGFYGGERLRLSTTGALPTGIDTISDYFVERIDANTFYLHAIRFFVGSSTRVATAGSQSGTHSYMQSFWGLGNGSTSFSLPDFRGEFVRGWDHDNGIDSGRSLGSWQKDQFQGHYHNIGVSADNDFVGYTSGGGGPGYAAGYGGSTPKARTPITDGTNGTPRTGAETRPRNIATMYIIKY